MGDLHHACAQFDILLIGLVGAVDHDAGEAVPDAGLGQLYRVSVVQVDGYGQVRIFLHGRIDNVLEVAHVGIFAGALGDLQDERSFFLRASHCDTLGDLHVVHVERSDGKSAVVGQVEHRLGGH